MTAAAESPQPNLLPAALAYVNRFKWPVFPVHGIVNGRCTCGKPDCQRPGKHPIGSLAPRGLHDASLDAETVTSWWRSAPYANIGVPTGTASGLVVIDVDTDKGGDDGLFYLQREHGEFPVTAMAITGGGGYHYLFRHPGGGTRIKNSVRNLGEGLDVRGDGGYIIVAPSSHRSGRRYEWEASCHPKDVLPAALPDWLQAMIADAPRAVRPSAKMSGTLPERERARIRDALSHIDCDAYDAWIQAGMALHSTGDESAFDLWAEWAMGSPKFDAEDHRRRWAGFKRDGGGITLASLFAAARAAGYAPRRDSADEPPPPPPDDPPPGGPDDPPSDWEGLLYRDPKTKAILTSPANMETILQYHDDWREVLTYDGMSCRTIKRRAPAYPGGEAGEWGDADDTWTMIWMERRYGIRAKVGDVARVVAATAQRAKFHQVADWLAGLEWDGIERLPTFFSDFCGTGQTPYLEAVGRAFFVSAVARVMDPGCKVDTMLVLEGRQGIGKSRLILALFSAKFHIEISYPPGSLDFYQALRGTWCAEFGEMAAFDKAETARIKQVLTQTQDTYRASYGHHTGTYPRQTVFVGSTNKREWGQDETGMRRFLPVTCGDINVAGATEAREQLWAEALHRFRCGEPWWDIPDAEREQEMRFDPDAWEELVAAWTELRAKRDGNPSFSINDVYQCAIHGDGARNVPPISRADQIRIGRVLTRLGWQRRRESEGGKRSYVYERAKP